MAQIPNGRFLPDVACDARTPARRLDYVGMRGVEVAVIPEDGQKASARCEVLVSLDDPQARGIHMSRLFLAVQEACTAGPLNLALIENLLEKLLVSHQDLSLEARVSFSFDLLALRPALVSQNRAWRCYPVTLGGSLRRSGLSLEMGAIVTYSSTCPCSSALSRQVVLDSFDQHFAKTPHLDAAKVRQWLEREGALAAVPHSQRSEAHIRAVVKDAASAPTLLSLIDQVEDALQTACQAAVKRDDEMEFAKRNAQHPMFCEDACRRIASLLDAHPAFNDWRVKAAHIESLHPHDAIAIATKGVSGGLRARD
jgi:GTP cyclohydrolase I